MKNLLLGTTTTFDFVHTSTPRHWTPPLDPTSDVTTPISSSFSSLSLLQSLQSFPELTFRILDSSKHKTVRRRVPSFPHLRSGPSSDPFPGPSTTTGTRLHLQCPGTPPPLWRDRHGVHSRGPVTTETPGLVSSGSTGVSGPGTQLSCLHRSGSSVSEVNVTSTVPTHPGSPV